MYQEFYGLNESPFALTPDPKYLFFSEAHKEALASMIYGVQERKGFVLILGEVGTGKTTLVHHLLGRFGTNIRTVFVFNPAVTFLELLQVILRDLELPCHTRRRVEMIDTLNDFLLKEASAGRYVVLIIDEAQHLSAAVLEEVRMLSNLETSRGKLLQIILVGQPELGEKLGRPELRQLRQRIGLVAELRPLSAEDTAQYIAHRLQIAGGSGRGLFTRRALKLIYRASRGIPRLVNVICDKSLVLAYGAGRTKANGRLVKEVLKDWEAFKSGSPMVDDRRPRKRRSPRGTGPSWRFVGGMATAGVVAAMGGLLYFGAPPAQWDRELPARLWRNLTSAAATSAALVKSAESPSPKSAESPSPPVAPAATEAAIPEPAVPVPKELPEPEPRPPRGSKPERVLPAGPREILPAEPREAQGPPQGRAVVVRPGDTLSGLVTQIYGRADLTLLDFATMANPQIQDIDRLQVGQRLRFPEFQPQAMVRQRDGSRYWLHLTTIWNTEEPGYRKLHAALGKLGREVYVVPVSLTRKDAAYRVMVGDFADRQQAEMFYQEFRPPAEVATQLWR